MSPPADDQKHGQKHGEFVVLVNKTARRNYEISQVFEAGISLLGPEVKSLREGQAELKEAYIRINDGEAYLIGCHISPYRFARLEDYVATRDRKLLLHRKEIKKLHENVKQKGLTIVPLRIYFKRGRCKLELGLGRGKKLFDKREDIKAKQADLAIKRVMKRLV